MRDPVHAHARLCWPPLTTQILINSVLQDRSFLKRRHNSKQKYMPVTGRAISLVRSSSTCLTPVQQYLNLPTRRIFLFHQPKSPRKESSTWGLQRHRPMENALTATAFDQEISAGTLETDGFTAQGGDITSISLIWPPRVPIHGSSSTHTCEERRYPSVLLMPFGTIQIIVTVSFSHGLIQGKCLNSQRNGGCRYGLSLGL